MVNYLYSFCLLLWFNFCHNSALTECRIMEFCVEARVQFIKTTTTKTAFGEEVPLMTMGEMPEKNKLEKGIPKFHL